MSADLSAGIYPWTQTIGAITALVGDRVYPVTITEQVALPYIVFEDDKDTEYAMHDAVAKSAKSAVTFMCFGKNSDAASVLAGAVVDALRAFRYGEMGAITVQWVVYKGSSPAYQWAEQEFSVDVKCDIVYNL